MKKSILLVALVSLYTTSCASKTKIKLSKLEKLAFAIKSHVSKDTYIHSLTWKNDPIMANRNSCFECRNKCYKCQRKCYKCQIKRGCNSSTCKSCKAKRSFLAKNKDRLTREKNCDECKIERYRKMAGFHVTINKYNKNKVRVFKTLLFQESRKGWVLRKEYKTEFKPKASGAKISDLEAIVRLDSFDIERDGSGNVYNIKFDKPGLCSITTGTVHDNGHGAGIIYCYKKSLLGWKKTGEKFWH